MDLRPGSGPRYVAEGGTVIRLVKPGPGLPARREVALEGIPGRKAKRIAAILNEPEEKAG